MGIKIQDHRCRFDNIQLFQLVSRWKKNRDLELRRATFFCEAFLIKLETPLFSSSKIVLS